MGMERLRELTPFVKEALQKTARVANFFCLLHVTGTYLCTVAYLVGPSMLPTFHEGNLVLTERISTRSGKVGSGDVVLVRRPDAPRSVVTKRVKGVEGDVVSYLLDPSKSDELKTVVVIVPKLSSILSSLYQRDIFGSKGITKIKVMIQESLVQSLMHFYIPEFSSWYGPPRTLDQLATMFFDFNLQISWIGSGGKKKLTSDLSTLV